MKNLTGQQVEKNQMREIRRQLEANKKSYIVVFEGDAGSQVLADLRKRCFEDVTTFDDSPTRMAFNEGRRSVFKYIENILERDINNIMGDLTNG